MPYIRQTRKDAINLRSDDNLETPGELTYALTVVAEHYRRIKGNSFSTFCVVIGAFVCAALEFYRRVVVPYEDGKSYENGDVYQPLPDHLRHPLKGGTRG